MQKNENQLKDTVDKILSTLKVYQGLSPIEKSYDQNALTKITKLLDNPLINSQQVKLIFEDILFSALIDSREGIVSNNQLRALLESTLISHVPDITKIGADIIKKLEALPISYKFLFRIPKLLSDRDTSLGKTMRIFKLTASDTTYTRPLRIADELFGGLQTLKEGDSLFEILADGFVGVHGQMAMVGDYPVYLWRSFTGILLAFNMIVRDSYVGGNLTPNYGARIYGREDNFVRIENTDVDDEIFVRDYTFTTASMFESVESIDWIKAFYSKALSESNNDSQEKGQILNGAYWLYEMQKSRSPYTRLFSGAIALDALIPVPQKSTNDRYIPWRNLFLAEAIGKSIKESKKISKDMDDFLILRNSIIHGKELQAIYDSGNLNLISSSGEYIESYLRKRVLSFVA